MANNKDMLALLKKAGMADGKMKETVTQKTPSYDVVSEDDTSHPVTEAECPKCKNSQAQWWSKQTRASDEPETRFFKCTACKHTWRDAS